MRRRWNLLTVAIILSTLVIPGLLIWSLPFRVRAQQGAPSPGLSLSAAAKRQIEALLEEKASPHSGPEKDRFATFICDESETGSGADDSTFTCDAP